MRSSKEPKSGEAYKKLKSVLERDGVSGRNSNYYCNKKLKEALENACKLENRQFVPVYYLIVEDENKNKIVYLSASHIGRVAQHRKWEDIMKNHVPCGHTLCPACLLFGTANIDGMKGHLRVSDAFIDENGREKINRKDVTLDILAAPRTSAFEFYLKS